MNISKLLLLTGLIAAGASAHGAALNMESHKRPADPLLRAKHRNTCGFINAFFYNAVVSPIGGYPTLEDPLAYVMNDIKNGNTPDRDDAQLAIDIVNRYYHGDPRIKEQIRLAVEPTILERLSRRIATDPTGEYTYYFGCIRGNSCLAKALSLHRTR